MDKLRGVDEVELFDLRGQALRQARDAIRAARERAGITAPNHRAPHDPRSLSHRSRTIPPMTGGGRMVEGAPAHGTRARYNSRTRPCRCELCQRANARYMRRYRAGDPGPVLPYAGRDVTDVEVKGRIL